MPTATATLQLNVSAIQLLCRGPRGSGILTGEGLPTTPGILTTSPVSGDFFIDTGTNAPFTINFHGPYTTSFPLTSVKIPTTALQASISASLFTSITSVSAHVDRFHNGTTSAYVTALSVFTPGITNTIQSVVINQDSTVNGAHPLHVRAQNITVLSVSNSATVGINTTNHDATLHVAGTLHTTGKVNIDTQLVVSGTCVLTPNVTIYTGMAGVSSYTVFTTNVPGDTTTLRGASSYCAIFAPNRANGNSLPATPVRIDSTTFEIGSASDYFMVADPIYRRRVTIMGTLSALSSMSVGYFDTNGNQVVGTRQAGPLKLASVTAASATLVDRYNTLVDIITAHGLAR